MTTEKQNKANQDNAQLSTGPKTEEGKEIVSKNAIKHGIFAKDLIISKGDGKENRKEYQQIVNNLIQCLNPTDQMQSLLVEKIAIDFWRLKRVIRFETGAIRQYLDTVIDDYYGETNYDARKKHKTNEEIDKEIKRIKEDIKWNDTFIGYLEKDIVEFDKPNWVYEGFESNIEEDLWMIFNEFGERIDIDTSRFHIEGELSFEEMKKILSDKGYTNKDISRLLIEVYSKQNEEELRKELDELEKQKIKNKFMEDVKVRLHSIPQADAEKIIRYERSIHKSILQNLVILKKLQGVM